MTSEDNGYCGDTAGSDYDDSFYQSDHLFYNPGKIGRGTYHGDDQILLSMRRHFVLSYF
jgi:hypothetical protein